MCLSSSPLLTKASEKASYESLFATFVQQNLGEVVVATCPNKSN